MSATDMEPNTFGDREFPMAAVAAEQGEIACINAAGYLTPGAVATGLVAIGIFKESRDNSAGAAGDVEAPVMTSAPRGGGRRTFFLTNSGTDACDQTSVGHDVFIAGPNTARKTSDSGACSRAGKCWGFDEEGRVEVEFDVDPDAVDLADVQAQLDELTAADVPIVDAGALFAASNVEAALAEAKGVADAALPAAKLQSGEVTLVAGTVSKNSGITITANSVVVISLKTPGAGARGDHYKVDGYTVGGPGVGAFTVTSVNTSAGDNIVNTAVDILKYAILG